ncbi:MAG: hypothetical protein LBU11_09610 [Zoogloeaceae bacterium]|jgi:hypothetical protein|nr:hypothetical protein [Zoogloeaceae bacterium]
MTTFTLHAPKSIPARLETMTHGQRWQAMSEIGRASRQDGALRAELAALARSETHYERLLALMSTFASHDADQIADFLLDPSESLARFILPVAARHGAEAMLIARMPGLPPQRRVLLANALHRAGRHAVNDAVHCALQGNAAVDILPFTSEDFLLARLGEAETVACLRPAHWRVLARRLPRVARDLLQRELARGPALAQHVINAVNTCLLEMARSAPKIGEDFLLKASAAIPLEQLPVSRYLNRNPALAGALVARKRSALRVRLSAHALRQLDIDTLRALLDADFIDDFASVFKKLRPEQRRSIYESHGESWRWPSGVLPLRHVEALPAALRQAEARRAFTAVELADKPLQRLPYLGCLAFAEALECARPYLSQPDGEIRAAAVAAIARAVRFDDSATDAMLDFCLKREHEQDPVRMEMLGALSRLPPSRWREAHPPKLKSIIKAALKARDCSAATMEHAANLLFRMLPWQARFVVETLPAVVERLGRIGSLSLEERVADRQMPALAEALMPLLLIWVKRDRPYFVMHLIGCFRHRARAVPAFAELLGEITNDKRAAPARHALDTLWEVGFKREVRRMIPELLAKDAGWILAPRVANHLHRHRQDLLTPFLAPRKYPGRFSRSRGQEFPLFGRGPRPGGFFRWTALQQQVYAKSHLGILESAKRSAWALFRSLNHLAALPSIDIAPIIELARVDARDVALRDRAVEALGRVDGGRGVEALIAALEDERGRVAIYALRRAILAMPEARALEFLARAPRNKLTVAKEILRLAGEFDGEAAFRFLMTHAGEEQHQDIRIALTRALWNHLHRPEAWTLMDAAASANAAFARATIPIPQDGLSAFARTRLDAHFAKLLRHPDALARSDALYRLHAMPLGRLGPELRAGVALFLEHPDAARRQTAAAVLIKSASGKEDTWPAEIFGALTSAPALQSVIKAFRQEGRSVSGVGEQLARQLARRLLARRWQAGLLARLVVSLLPPGEAVELLRAIEATGLLHPGAVAQALKSARELCAHHAPGWQPTAPIPTPGSRKPPP